jgi:ABC-2 type transport system ATP-binding protein
MTDPTPSDWVIDLSDVDKKYRGKVHALRGIQMRVARGEVFGLLGPNGAGKSTLVKILMTVISPSRCSGTMLGRPVGHKPTLARVGYLPEHHRFPEYLTGLQVVEFYGALCGLPRAHRRRRAAELTELVGMKEWAGAKVKGYSKGMRQRIGIAQALVTDPDLVLLDEPTDGVDPVGRREIRQVLQHVKGQGKTVFLNSHLLSELEMVCDRVAIMVQGRVASQGTIEELTRGQEYYEFELDGAGDDGRAGPTLLPESLAGGWKDGPALLAPYSGAPSRRAMIGTLPTGELVQAERNLVRVQTTNVALAQRVIDGLRSHGVAIRAVRPMRPSLEDLFMRAVTDPETGRTLAVGAAADARAAAGNGGGR